MIGCVTPGDHRGVEKNLARRGVSLSAVIYFMVIRSLGNDAQTGPTTGNFENQGSEK